MKEQFRETDLAKKMLAMHDKRSSILQRRLSSPFLAEHTVHEHVNVLGVIQVGLLSFLSLFVDLPCSRHIRFDVFSGHQIQQQAHLHVVSKSLYSQDNARSAVPYGVLDHHMVSVWAGEGICQTETINECLLWC